MVSTLTQSDALAIAMLVVLGLSFGCVLAILVVIYRKGKEAESEVQQLLDEVAEEDREPEKVGPPDDTESRQPWERDESWWRR